MSGVLGGEALMLFPRKRQHRDKTIWTDQEAVPAGRSVLPRGNLDRDTEEWDPRAD